MATNISKNIPVPKSSPTKPLSIKQYREFVRKITPATRKAPSSRRGGVTRTRIVVDDTGKQLGAVKFRGYTTKAGEVRETEADIFERRDGQLRRVRTVRGIPQFVRQEAIVRGEVKKAGRKIQRKARQQTEIRIAQDKEKKRLKSLRKQISDAKREGRSFKIHPIDYLKLFPQTTVEEESLLRTGLKREEIPSITIKKDDKPKDIIPLIRKKAEIIGVVPVKAKGFKPKAPKKPKPKPTPKIETEDFRVKFKGKPLVVNVEPPSKSTVSLVFTQEGKLGKLNKRQLQFYDSILGYEQSRAEVTKPKEVSQLKKFGRKILGQAQKGKFGEGIQQYYGLIQTSTDDKGKIIRSPTGKGIKLAENLIIGAVSGVATARIFAKVSLLAPKLAKTIGKAGTTMWIGGIPFRVAQKRKDPSALAVEFAGDIGFLQGLKIGGVKLKQIQGERINVNRRRFILKKVLGRLTKKEPPVKVVRAKYKQIKSSKLKSQFIKSYIQQYKKAPKLQIELTDIRRLRSHRIGSEKGRRKGFRKLIREQIEFKKQIPKKKPKAIRKKEVDIRKSERLVAKLRKGKSLKAERKGWAIIDGKKQYWLPKSKKYSLSRKKWLKEVKSLALIETEKHGFSKDLIKNIVARQRRLRNQLKTQSKSDRLQSQKVIQSLRRELKSKKAPRGGFTKVGNKKIYTLSNGKLTNSRKKWLRDIKEINQLPRDEQDLILQLKRFNEKKLRLFQDIIKKNQVKPDKFTKQQLQYLKAENKIIQEKLRRESKLGKQLADKIEKGNKEQKLITKDGQVLITEKKKKIVIQQKQKQVAKEKPKAISRQKQKLAQLEFKQKARAKTTTRVIQVPVQKLRFFPIKKLKLDEKTNNLTILKQKGRTKQLLKLVPKQKLKQEQKQKLKQEVKQVQEQKPKQIQKLQQRLKTLYDVRQRLDLKQKTSQIVDQILETVPPTIIETKIPRTEIEKRLKEEIEKLKKKRKKKNIFFEYTPTLAGIGLRAKRTTGVFTGFEVRGNIIKPVIVKRHRRKTLKRKKFVRKHRRRKPRK